MYHECTIIDTSQQCNCSSAVLDCCRAQTKNRRVGLIRLKIHVPDRAQVQEPTKKRTAQTPIYSGVVNGKHCSPVPSLFSTLSSTTTALSIKRKVKTRYHDVVKWPLSAQSHRCVPLLASPRECGTASASTLVRQYGSLCIVAGTTCAMTPQRSRKTPRPGHDCVFPRSIRPSLPTTWNSHPRLRPPRPFALASAEAPCPRSGGSSSRGRSGRSRTTGQSRRSRSGGTKAMAWAPRSSSAWPRQCFGSVADGGE